MFQSSGLRVNFIDSHSVQEAIKMISGGMVTSEHYSMNTQGDGRKAEGLTQSPSNGSFVAPA